MGWGENTLSPELPEDIALTNVIFTQAKSDDQPAVRIVLVFSKNNKTARASMLLQIAPDPASQAQLSAFAQEYAKVAGEEAVPFPPSTST
ncbi:unnamed protein product [Didymodactylos carnosus]|uniref:Uncharacterized protein n=1 Tax=Didymodactylos carnosus TaxID=1234261 RepID=A0A8S2CQS7_9BILA|nr:unnamed protein product [Didymodactylos carnosus]CAF3496103.1 unnamed protein product [Didymodactylos carnosus]